MVQPGLVFETPFGTIVLKQPIEFQTAAEKTNSILQNSDFRNMSQHRMFIIYM